MIKRKYSKSIYSNIRIDYKPGILIFKGVLGELFLKLKNKNYFFFTKKSESLKDEMHFWLSKKYYRTFLSKLEENVQGVCFGWSVSLEVQGRNYNVHNYQIKNIHYLYLDLGYSHNILLKVPENVKVFCKKKVIFLYGYNLLKVKNLADTIIKLKPINVYKGKGIKFLNQKVLLKVGKQSQYK